VGVGRATDRQIGVGASTNLYDGARPLPQAVPLPHANPKENDVMIESSHLVCAKPVVSALT
jgi:hypothetical protein